MSNTLALTGEDTLTIFGRVITDVADGDDITVTFPNDLVTMKTGKNKNTMYAKNETGNNATMQIRVIKGSADDRFLLGKLNEMRRDLPSFSTAESEFVKRVGDGQGNVIDNIYNLQGGIFTKMVDTKSNAEGDTEQAISVYNMMFALGVQSIG